MPRINKTEAKEAKDNLFSEMYARTNKPSQSIIAAYPELANNPEYAKVKAQRELKRPDIKAKIDKNIQKMSKKALKRVDQLLTSDNEQIATVNSWKVIEHNIGTPIRRTVGLTANISIEDALNQLM